MRPSLASSVLKLGKQKIVTASVVDVVGDLCSVRLSGNGSILRGLKYSGPSPKVGDIVNVDYRGGRPTVIAQAKELYAKVDELDRKSEVRASIPAPVPTSPPEDPAPASGSSVGDEQIAFGSSGSLVGDNILRWSSVLRGIRWGRDFADFNYADVYPFVAVSNSVDQPLYIALYAYGSSPIAKPGLRTYRSGGTDITPSAIQSGYVIRDDRSLGHDGSVFASGGQDEISATENWTSTARGTKRRISLIKEGESVRRVVLEMFGNGLISAADTGRFEADNGLAFQRKLNRNLVLEDGECLITGGYIDPGVNYYVDCSGDSFVEVI